MRKVTLCLLLLFYVPNTIFGQDKQTSTYKEHFVNAEGVNLHYLDFGGKGLPVIFLQSFHGDAMEWVDYDFVGFAPRFTKNNRVFAITRRGWGKSTDPGWGYDVATQAEDVIAFMNALKLEKAIMVGRIPANMDITWIAEHHPDRLAGIIFIGTPYLYLDLSDTLVQHHVEMVATEACDLGNDAIRKSLPRSSWRPHFLYDSTKRIQIPALRILRPGELKEPARELKFFDDMMEYAKTGNFRLCNTEAQAYYAQLSKDSLYQRKVKEALMKADKTILMNEAVDRAFGSNMKTITQAFPPFINSEEEYSKYWLEILSEFYYNNMIAFINPLTK
jgi:pimeloyl-ACP methyl ester carboxylesterase